MKVEIYVDTQKLSELNSNTYIKSVMPTWLDESKMFQCSGRFAKDWEMLEPDTFQYSRRVGNTLYFRNAYASMQIETEDYHKFKRYECYKLEVNEL